MGNEAKGTVDTGGKQGIPASGEGAQEQEQEQETQEEGQQTQAQQQVQTEGAVSGKKLGGKFSPDKQYIPYERVQQIQGQFEGKIAELQQALAQLQKGQGEAVDPEAKARSEKFWKGPQEYVDEGLEAIHQRFQEEVGKRLILRDLRSSPGFSRELEQRMVEIIQENRLGKLDPEAAVKVAYKLATGKELGRADNQGGNDGYTTRMTKERLSKPSSAGGAGAEGGMSLEDFNRMSLAEFSKNPQGNINKLLASQEASQ